MTAKRFIQYIAAAAMATAGLLSAGGAAAAAATYEFSQSYTSVDDASAAAVTLTVTGDPGVDGFLSLSELTSRVLTFQSSYGNFALSGTAIDFLNGASSFQWVVGESTFLFTHGFAADASGIDLVTDVDAGTGFLLGWTAGQYVASASMLNDALYIYNPNTSDYYQFAPNTAVSVQEVTAVPEPETYALMLAGLGVLGAVARRRRQ